MSFDFKYNSKTSNSIYTFGTKNLLTKLHNNIGFIVKFKTTLGLYFK